RRAYHLLAGHAVRRFIAKQPSLGAVDNIMQRAVAVEVAVGGHSVGEVTVGEATEGVAREAGHLPALGDADEVVALVVGVGEERLAADRQAGAPAQVIEGDGAASVGPGLGERAI